VKVMQVKEDKIIKLSTRSAEAAEAFYTPEGELALSREYVDLRHLMGSMRGEGVIAIG
jgi:hypothetical protein